MGRTFQANTSRFGDVFRENSGQLLAIEGNGMEISRDSMAETEGTTSIRLRYSRQFQSNGHAHTIDAEATVAVGASPERREQIIRELEAGVEQLARQITQRGTRPASEAQSPTPVRPSTASDRTPEPSASQPTLPRPASTAAQPTAPLPVSESMPTTPGASKDRNITLPQFLNAIRKRWDMSSEEAKSLLHVSELSGLNYKEAYDTLRAIKESSAPQSSNTAPARPPQQPVVEAPRQTNRSAPSAPNARPSASQAAPPTAPVTRAPGASSPRNESQPTSQVASVSPSALTFPQEPKQTAPAYDGLPAFAGSSKAPLPIQHGVVRDLAPRSYAFEEEDEEEYALPTSQPENEHLQAAESKLDDLKNLRSGNAASPERLNVLNNVLDGQISEEQLEQLIKLAWNATNKKRLKVPQVEALISWAKEDYFIDEVESLLALVAEEEE